MNQVLRASPKFGSIRDFTEWRQRVVRDQNASDGAKTWFDHDGTGRGLTRLLSRVAGAFGGTSAVPAGGAGMSVGSPPRGAASLAGSRAVTGLTWRRASSTRTIRARLDWATATAIAVIAALLTAAYLVEARRADEARTARIRTAIEAAVSIASSYEREERAGQITQTEAKKAALAAIGAIRFGGGSFILVTDLHARVVMNPASPETAGNDLSGIAAPDGTRVFASLVKVALSPGSHAIDYLWPRDGGPPAARRSYVQAFSAWGWVFSGSSFVDDLAAERVRLATYLAVLGLAISAGFALVMGHIGRGLARRLRDLAASAEALAQGDLSVTIGGVTKRDEIGILAFSLDMLRRTAIERVQIVKTGLEERAAKERRQAAMDSLVRDFNQALSGVLGQLSQAVRRLPETADGGFGDPSRAKDAMTRAAREWDAAAVELRAIAASTSEVAGSLGAIAGKAALSDGAEAQGVAKFLAAMAKRAAEAGNGVSGIAARADRIARDAMAGLYGQASLGGQDGPAAGDIATAAGQIERVVETLRYELDRFIEVLVRGDTFRRRYERVAGHGARAELVAADGRHFSAVIQDISFGGAALLSGFEGAVGDAVEVAFPEGPAPVSARVVRHAAGVVAVAFRQDPETMAVLGPVIDALPRLAPDDGGRK